MPRFDCEWHSGSVPTGTIGSFDPVDGNGNAIAWTTGTTATVTAANHNGGAPVPGVTDLAANATNNGGNLRLGYPWSHADAGSTRWPAGQYDVSFRVYLGGATDYQEWPTNPNGTPVYLLFNVLPTLG